MDKQSVIAALEEIAVLLELKGENPFKSRAYQTAARKLNSLSGEVGELLASGELARQGGFGEALLSKIGELVTSGRLVYLENLRAEFPPGLLAMLDLPGLGPKKVKLFYDKLGLTSISELAVACRDGRVAGLPGCGDKTAAKLLEAIARREENAGLFLYEEARAMADEVLAALKTLPGLTRIELAGSLRRTKEITKDLDLVGATDTPAPIMAAFTSLPGLKQVLAHGATKSSIILANGMQADLRLVPPGQFASAWHHFTGSKDHNVALRSRALKLGLKVSEWGLFRVGEDGSETPLPVPDEAALFAQLGLAWVPPELREDMGEIAAAEAAALPKLVTLADYRGMLHCHSEASDGSDTLAALVAHAHGLGHQYLGITDHSKASFQANGLNEERLLAQRAAIHALRPTLPKGFQLLSGVECDILTDGSLDVPEEVRRQLDLVVISVHSGFNRDADDNTARLIRAMEQPRVHILGHLTGRLLLHRDGYALHVEKILDAAVANGVAIELNCNPRRLDMDWRWWQRARAKGVRCSLNADAHSLDGFAYTEAGIQFCRKGWLTADDILNCWPAERLLAHLAKR